MIFLCISGRRQRPAVGMRVINSQVAPARLAQFLEKGEEFEGKVVKIVNFGAFVELGSTGKEALLHISKIADHRVENVADYLEVGQKLSLKIDDVDQNGKISVKRVTA